MPDNLLLQLHSSTRRTTVRLSKEQMMTTNHTQPRDCVATIAHSYNTHNIANYNMLRFHRRRRSASRSDFQRCVAMQRSSAETLWFLGKDSNELRKIMVEWVYTYAVANAEDDRMRSEPPPRMTSAAFNCMHPGRHLSSWRCMHSLLHTFLFNELRTTLGQLTTLAF
jgi:hypothetical protein